MNRSRSNKKKDRGKGLYRGVTLICTKCNRTWSACKCAEKTLDLRSLYKQIPEQYRGWS